MSFTLIVATSENHVIGNKGDIPWNIPTDQERFRALTRGHTVVMGRKTYESIITILGKPLPNRKNIIITRQKDFAAPGCEVLGSWEEVLEKYKDSPEEIFIIGGGEIYKLALPYANKINLTVVHAKVDGDAKFEFNTEDWQLITPPEKHTKNEKDQFDFTYYDYERK